MRVHKQVDNGIIDFIYLIQLVWTFLQFKTNEKLNSRGKSSTLQLFPYFYLDLHKILSPKRSHGTQQFNSIAFSDIG